MAEKRPENNGSDTQRLERLIGLAARAGRIRSGGFQAEESVRSGKAALCMLAMDASDNTIKNVEDMCRSKNVQLITAPFDKEALGHMIGRGERSVITVEDQGFAESMLKLTRGRICL